MDIFKNTAHKLDIQTAVEISELVQVRCIRIHAKTLNVIQMDEFVRKELTQEEKREIERIYVRKLEQYDSRFSKAL